MSDLKCWMCDGLGAVRLYHSIRLGVTVWLPFKPEPQGNIRLNRDEHVCPACGGAGNPR